MRIGYWLYIYMRMVIGEVNGIDVMSSSFEFFPTL